MELQTREPKVNFLTKPLKAAKAKNIDKTTGIKRKRNPKSITVIGKRWYDKVNGNTYCASRIYFDGIEVMRCPFEYGYGSFYIQRAGELLASTKTLPLKKYDNGGTEALWLYCSNNNIQLNDQVFDGCLKRDVKEWGE